jgi:hypothetical protein
MTFSIFSNSAYWGYHILKKNIKIRQKFNTEIRRNTKNHEVFCVALCYLL